MFVFLYSLCQERCTEGVCIILWRIQPLCLLVFQVRYCIPVPYIRFYIFPLFIFRGYFVLLGKASSIYAMCSVLLQVLLASLS